MEDTERSELFEAVFKTACFLCRDEVIVKSREGGSLYAHPNLSANTGKQYGWSACRASALRVLAVQWCNARKPKTVETAEDQETAEWVSFLKAWSEVYGAEAVSVAEILGKSTIFPDIRHSLPAFLSYKDEDQKSARIKIGKALGKIAGRSIGSLLLEQAGTDTASKSTLWKVRRVSGGATQ